MPVKDAPVIEAMKRLSSHYPRYGYRRIHLFLGREGQQMGRGRVERIWRSAKLQLPRRRPRRSTGVSRARALPALVQASTSAVPHSSQVGQELPSKSLGAVVQLANYPEASVRCSASE